jgi:hypothetical protein
MVHPPLTVRPIVHTAHLSVWLDLFRALGPRTLTSDPMWTELQLDRGRVTLTILNRGAREGDVSLGSRPPTWTLSVLQSRRSRRWRSSGSRPRTLNRCVSRVAMA